VDVTVTTAGGPSATGSSDKYTFVAKPSVSSVSPNAGPKAGGQTVTVRGTGFRNGATVKFGSTPGTHVTVVTGAKLTVKTPRHAAGQVDVTVHTGGGTSATSSKDHYTFDKRPKVTNVTPSSGSKKGGDKVTVDGKGFLKGAKVKFGGTAGKSVHVVSSTKLEVTSPKHSKGTVDVHVTTAGGTSKAKSADHYTFT
jgi:hypothetical protein